MIIEDMTQMAQFVYDFYNQKIDLLMLKQQLPQVRLINPSFRNYHGVVDKSLSLYPGVPHLIPGFSSLSDETLSHGPPSPYMTLAVGGC